MEAFRLLPVGAEIGDGGVSFRVWAPRRRKVELILEGPQRRTVAMAGQPGGYFAALVEEAGAGTRYRYRLDGEGPFPDPASRFQPEGPHGPSQVVDPARYRWEDAGWKGVALRDAVFYELHVGTFTGEGTWAAAARELPRLAGLGVTVVEMMPVADFPGDFGWGYDGVDLFAPTRLYGQPDDLRRFVDRAHALGVAVILDVVYNHLGPDGNYLKQYSDDYFSTRYENEWGEPINFDGERSSQVREFFVANAGYWIDEFHFDGLRLDATQQIFDASKEHILAAVSRRVREAARGRLTLLVAENETQDARLLDAPAKGGFGLDAAWNDDFHHTARVALTGHTEAYFTDYRGTPQELISAVKRGWLYQGQRYSWQKKRRGTPALHVDPTRFVTYLCNHDQIANSACGRRLHQLAAPGLLRAMTAMMLLAPPPPFLFQGQELATDAPWNYFAHHKPELAKLVREGRAKFLAQFDSAATPEMQRLLSEPSDRAAFEACKIDASRGDEQALALHGDLLRLRRDDPVIGARGEGGFDGAVLSERAFLLRWLAGGQDRLLLVNLGADLRLVHAPEPLLAPPAGARWTTLWSSEDPAYGGCGTPPLDGDDEGFRIPGYAAVLLAPAPRDAAERRPL